MFVDILETPCPGNRRSRQQRLPKMHRKICRKLKNSAAIGTFARSDKAGGWSFWL